MDTPREGSAGATGLLEGVDLAKAMVDIAEAMASAPDRDSTALVIAEAAVALIPGVDEASVSLARRAVGIQTLASTGVLPDRADEAQVASGEGPCIEVAWDDNRVAHLPDTWDHPQWPKFSQSARTLGVGSMLSFELSLPTVDEDDDRIGAINTYSRRAHAFDASSSEIGRILAVHASVGLGAAQREAQLREALDSRDLIGQAKGLIMAQQDISAEEAFDLLVRQSRDTNTRLRDLAMALLAGHRPQR